MKIDQLISKLEAIRAEQGNIEVMFEDREGQMLSVNVAKAYTAGADEFDEDWCMPEGFTFVHLTE